MQSVVYWRTIVVLMCVFIIKDVFPDSRPAISKLNSAMEKLRPLHKPLQLQKPGDWLANHKESGQTFQEYLRSRPLVPRGKRKIIYIQPLGDFTPAQRAIVTNTAAFIGRFYNLHVKINPDIPLSVIPATAQRHHPRWGMKQILTSYVLDQVLKPALPHDAFAMIALTASDLWPGKGWNFVFGQASLRDGVGVWSLYRNGNPEKNQDEFRLCLLRTMKTAVHELGHMFSMLHCVRYQCGMCGSNSREESDRRPLRFCPECMAKVCLATGADPAGRYRKLAAFCQQHKLIKERDFYRKSISVLTTNTAAAAK